jgi:hypothetical protein
VLYKVSSSCSTYGTRRITLATNIYEIQMNVYVLLRITASDNPFVIFKLCHADDENLAQSLIGHDCSVGTEYQDMKLK